MLKRNLLFAILLPLLSCNSLLAGSFGFEEFKFNDKLPSNSVIRTYNDLDGYMWFGTKDGLCRFDGYDIKIFRSSASTPGRLTNNEIQCLTEDKMHRLWVGTLEGINIIDKHNFTVKPVDNKYVNKERINSIICDRDGFIWVGTSTNGIVRIDPNTFDFERYTPDVHSKYKLNGGNVSNLFLDSKGRIWVSYWRAGLNCIDPSRKTLLRSPQIGSNNNPFRVFEDKDGLFWICTWGDGIFTIKPDLKNGINVQPIRLAAGGATESLHNIVYSITQDDKNNLIWVVTFNGLNLIEKLPDGTCRLLSTSELFAPGTSRLFHEISKDHHGNMWLGSVGEGLYKLDFNKGSIRNYPLNDIVTKLNLQSYVTKLCETSPNNLFIAINRIGLFHFDLNTGAVSRPSNQAVRSLTSVSALLYRKKANELWLTNEGEGAVYIFNQAGKDDLSLKATLNLNNSAKPDDFSISSFYEDNYGNVWIGTDNGLYLKPNDGKLQLVTNRYQFVNTISEDTKHRIWIGTDKSGLFFVTRAGKSYKVNEVPLKINNYRSFGVQSVCCSKTGDVYAATKEGCIYRYNDATGVAEDISGKYGITDEGILDLQEDNEGLLWISTIKKIVRFNPRNQASTYFSTADGMLVSSFFKDAHLKTSEGLIAFGGNKGICVFNPQLQPKTTGSGRRVTITDILVQNKSVFDDDAANMHYEADDKTVTMKYSENNLSIEFSALDYRAARKIQYAYKLSGVDKNWNYVGNSRRFVNYANLPVGSYTFLVKASDENGVWSEQVTSMEVQILPPLYRTWWAYLIYFCILVVAGFVSARVVINRIRLRNELKISLIDKQKSEELTQIKLRYFTNISHELLTPLTIILLQIDSLRKKNIGNPAQFDVMKDNVIRLKRLIQQILIFRKTESGNMKLEIKENDVVAFVKNICKSNFKPLVSKKKIHFKVDVEDESRLAFFDPDKLDKIIYNLLSNAVKHTPEGGYINVKISFIQREKHTILRLSVSDSGTGIAEKDLPHIFKRFYISSTSDQSQSHGIGLALTSDLINIHKGTIDVKSVWGDGAVFTIEIPVSENAYDAHEMAVENTDMADIPELQDNVVYETESQELSSDDETPEDMTVMIVEDNPELLELISNNFTSKYHVLRAANGVEALALMKDNDVDLIISDVMMPEMDGLTFCRTIKNDINSSHINILMLTAKNSTEDRIECYNAGADAYIAKPFELAILNARARNLLKRRKQKTETFQKNQEINISSMEYGSIDEAFLKQAVKKVEEKLSDENFDFDQFAVDMATSKSTLHRKLKSLTGLSPGEFIRNIRLKHAAMMLTKNAGNISEIAFSVGFNDPKYFSRCFKIEFGLTPREYQESQKG